MPFKTDPAVQALKRPLGCTRTEGDPRADRCLLIQCGGHSLYPCKPLTECHVCGTPFTERQHDRYCDACYPYGDSCDVAKREAERLHCKTSELPAARAVDAMDAAEEQRAMAGPRVTVQGGNG